jgi:peptide/nickel transport system substrate-binding protein
VKFARHCSAFIALVAALGPAACGDLGSGDKSVVIASGGDADVIVPLLWSQGQGRLYSELMFEKLADIGPARNTVGDQGYQPRLAKSWTWSADSLAVTFALDPKARWHDGRPVTARDVQFAFQVFTDPIAASAAGADLASAADSISVVDSLTCTVWFKARSAEQFHSVAYNLLPLPAHLLEKVPHDSIRASAFASHPIGNGPFKFVSWQKGVRFELAANDSFAGGRPKLSRVIFIITDGASSSARAVFAGDADFVETLTPEDLAEVARHPDVRADTIGGYDYGFLSFNLHTLGTPAPHPIFADVGVRRALTMATDRVAMVRNVLESTGRPGIGPFSRSQWSADTTLRSIPYDPAAAERLLDSLGWKRGADSTRAKGGRPLAFTMSVAATNKARPRFAELLQQSFARIGVKSSIELLDGRAMGTRVGEHKFDAALFSWRSTPSPSGSRQTWGIRSWKPGSPFNAGGFADAAFNAHIDTALSERSANAARPHFSAAYQAAIDAAPAIWLYEPMNVAAVNKRVVVGTLPPDAWWQSIRNWDVTGPARRSASDTAKKAP